MQRFEHRFEPWNPLRFSLVGASFGFAYGLAMGAVVGIYSFDTIDLLIWGVTSSTLFGAGAAGGVAMLRNYLAGLLTGPRRERIWTKEGFAVLIRPRSLLSR